MYQQLTIIGNLGRDPELRYMPDGTGVANLSVAVSEKEKQADGSYADHTTWFRVTLWGKQAENANQYLAKGRQVLVVGRLKSDENGNPKMWTGNNGQARASFEMSGSTIKYLGKKGDYEDVAAPSGSPAPALVEDDGFPF